MPSSTITNGNGHHYHHHQPRKKAPISGSNNTKKNKSPPKILMVFLALLVVLTLFVDYYFLTSTHPNLGRMNLKRRIPSPKHTDLLKHPSAGHASVSKPYTRRTFKFQDEKHDNELPDLKPHNKEDITMSEKQQPGSKSTYDFGKEPILRVFKQAGIPLPLNATLMEELPTWDQIVKVIGPHPVIGGLDTCEAFKRDVPAVERMLGSSGMFNTGTNLVTHLLKNNCKIPERVEKYGPDASREMHGMRWQVPWGKHSPAKYKEEHSTQKAKTINKDWIMPMVTIRHPYSWMHSMCKNGYTAKWQHGRKGNNCPNLQLKESGDWNEVTTKFADGRTEYSDSLAHLWNDWYKMYIEDARYPRLIVRLEDLVFHAQETTTAICNCVGGEVRKDRPFTYVLDSAKADSRGHDTSTGFVQAWIKYSKPMPPRGGFTPSDYQASKEALNTEYMKMFHYEHPPPAGGNEEEDTER